MILEKRPMRVVEEADAETLETIHRHYDNSITALDERRIAQITEVATGDTDADTIANLVLKVNELLTALNASDLTEEDS